MYTALRSRRLTMGLPHPASLRERFLCENFANVSGRQTGTTWVALPTGHEFDHQLRAGGVGARTSPDVVHRPRQNRQFTPGKPRREELRAISDHSCEAVTIRDDIAAGMPPIDVFRFNLMLRNWSQMLSQRCCRQRHRSCERQNPNSPCDSPSLVGGGGKTRGPLSRR